jgi:hypothetical protein
MKISARHAFACTPQQLHDLLDDEAFNHRLLDAARIDAEVLQNERIDGVMVRRVRCVSRDELPGFMSKAMGIQRLEYEQRSTTDPASGDIRWEVHPAMGGDRVQTRGTTVVRPTAGGCERIVDGECTVRIRLIGGKVEKLLVDGTHQRYEEAAALIRAELQARRG